MDVEVIGLVGALGTALLGIAGYYIHRQGRATAEILEAVAPLRPLRYIPETYEGDHLHQAGSVQAGLGWYCDIPVGKDERGNPVVCGLHKHVYEIPISGEAELKRCQCSQVGTGKEWA